MRIIAIGKNHADYVKSGIELFSKRLTNTFSPKWDILSSSKAKSKIATLNDESDRILKSIKASDFVILLDQTGKMIDSPALSHLVSRHANQIVFVVGGAYGVSDKLKQRSDYVWSLSKLVFPHQLVRLILIEQLYRAQTISQQHPYHH